MNGVAFVANGKQHVAAHGTTVAEFLEQHGLPQAQVIVEYNGDPLQRERYGETVLSAGDRIEIAQMVGGG